MRSMVSRTRSRITRSMVSAATSRPSLGSRFLLSLPMASSSGTRCPAGAVVGQLRRMMTPSFHFSTTRPTLPGELVDHDYWVTEALSTFGALFRGATAYPRARGVWRDDEEGGALKFEEPTSSSPTRTHPTLRK